MKLISIELHNFRKFQHAEINFPNGIIGIIGSNGAGKSTIIEAIGWAIYGNKASRTQKDQIKRQGAAASDDCWVRLRFEMNGNSYEILRILKANFSDAQAKVNDGIAATTSTGVTKFLEKKIGMNYDSFYTSIVAKQKELNALSNKTPADRKKNMFKMLKIDAIEDAIKRVREDKREKNSVIQHIEKVLKDVDEIIKEKIRKEAEKENLLISAKKIDEEISEKEKILFEVEEERKKEKEKAEKFNKLSLKKKSIESKIFEKTSQMKEKEMELEMVKKAKNRYNEIKNIADEYDEIKEKKEKMDEIREKFFEKKRILKEKDERGKNIKEMEGEISKLNEKIKIEEDVRKRKEFLENKIANGDRKILQMEKYVERKRVEIEETERKEREIEEKLKNIKKLGPESNCPMCGRKLGSHYEKLLHDLSLENEELERKIQEMKKENEELERKIQEMKKENEDNKNELKEIDNKIKRIDSIKDRIGYYRERIETEKNKVEELIKKLKELEEIEIDEKLYQKISLRIKEIEKIKMEAIRLQKEMERLPLIISSIKRIKESIVEISKEKEIIDMQINSLSFDRNEYEKVEKKYEEVVRGIGKLREEKIKKEEKIFYMEKEIKRIEKEIEEQNSYRRKIDDMKKEMADLILLEELLNKFKNYLISKIGPSLSFYASHFFSIFTGGKYNNIEIDDNYDIFIYDKGGRFPIYRFSGGEEDLANLSLRLAISELIARRADTNFEFIALDEIFGSQDNERRKNVLNALNELKSQFNQVLLITHIEEIKDEMEHIIKIYEDDEGISHVKIE